MPDDVRRALLKILYFSLISIRANAGNRDVCFCLAEHVHNIPDMLEDYSPEGFRYYWEVENPHIRI